MLGLAGLGRSDIPGTCRTGMRLVVLVQVYLPEWFTLTLVVTV